MSLEWLLKSIDISQYENGATKISGQDLEVIQSEVFSTQTLINNLNGSSLDISCLILETLTLDDDTIIDIITAISNIIVPKKVDVQWENANGFLKNFKHDVFFILRLLSKIFDSALIDSETRYKLNNALSYYHLESVPWSNTKLLQISTSCLSKSTVIENDLLSNLTQKLVELKKINKFNTNLQKRNELFKNINPNIGFFKTSSFELDQWKSQNIKLLSTLHYLISQSCQEFTVIIPLLLNFIEDHEVDIKIISCDLLHKVLQSTDSLSRYREIFIESLEKCLLYLPSLTPTDKSLKILSISYDSLLIIYQESPSDIVNLIQDNVLTSILSMRDKSFEILEFLLKLLLKLIPIVKFKIITTLSSLNLQILNILIDPYLLSYQELLVTDIEVLLQVAKYCWPVINKYKYDYLSGIVLCGKRLETGKHDKVMMQLRDLVTVLSSCCENFDSDITSLIDKDTNLKFLK